MAVVAAGTGEQIQRQSQVVNQMDRLGSSTNALETISVELIKRLEPILVAESLQVEEGNKSEVEKELVPHAENIKHIVNRMNNAISSLNYALDRLEL